MPKQREAYTVARLERGGNTFEILVDPELALRYKMGEKVPITKVLAYEEVYRDWRKGVRASESELRKFFGEVGIHEIAARIIAEGEVQTTADQRRRLVEEKRKQIIDFIARNAIDPRTNMPQPPQRVELALEEVGFSVDPFLDAKQQAMKAIERLRTVLPLKIGVIRVRIRIPGDLMGKSYGMIKSMGQIVDEKWLGDGSWSCEAEVPTGLHAELIEKLNRLCGGRVEITPVS
ncbi:MAG: ribosome assembly factor SBDS [Nitrososphaerota archaeon]